MEHKSYVLHNAIRDAIATFGRQAGLNVDVEPVRLLTDPITKKVTKSRPADIRIRSAHGWRAAGNRDMWIDVTTISAVCAKRRAKCAAAAGGGSAVAVANKNGKYAAGMKSSSNYGYFLPLAFESEGFMPKAVSQLLGPWSKAVGGEGRVRADGRGAPQAHMAQRACAHPRAVHGAGHPRQFQVGAGGVPAGEERGGTRTSAQRQRRGAALGLWLLSCHPRIKMIPAG